MKTNVDVYSVFLHVALVGLCALTVVLALENRRLKQGPESLGPEGPAIGQSLEPVRWQPLDGEEAVLELASGERDHFLLVFTTDCPACRENQEAWRTLHREVGDAAEVVGISLSPLDATRAYRDEHGLTFPVGLPAEPAAFIQELAITGVPMTLHVGPDGRVRGSWSGTLSADRLAELSAAGRES